MMVLEMSLLRLDHFTSPLLAGTDRAAGARSARQRYGKPHQRPAAIAAALQANRAAH